MSPELFFEKNSNNLLSLNFEVLKKPKLSSTSKIYWGPAKAKLSTEPAIWHETCMDLHALSNFFASFREVRDQA